MASVGFDDPEQSFERTDTQILRALTRGHVPVKVKACYEGQVVVYLQTIYGVVNEDAEGGYTDEVEGPRHGSTQYSTECQEISLIGKDITQIELFYDSGDGVVRIVWGTTDGEIEASSDLEYEKVG